METIRSTRNIPDCYASDGMDAIGHRRLMMIQIQSGSNSSGLREIIVNKVRITVEITGESLIVTHQCVGGKKLTSSFGRLLICGWIANTWVNPKLPVVTAVIETPENGASLSYREIINRRLFGGPCLLRAPSPRRPAEVYPGGEAAACTASSEHALRA